MTRVRALALVFAAALAGCFSTETTNPPGRFEGGLPDITIRDDVFAPRFPIQIARMEVRPGSAVPGSETVLWSGAASAVARGVTRLFITPLDTTAPAITVEPDAAGAFPAVMVEGEPGESFRLQIEEGTSRTATLDVRLQGFELVVLMRPRLCIDTPEDVVVSSGSEAAIRVVSRCEGPLEFDAPRSRLGAITLDPSAPFTLSPDSDQVVTARFDGEPEDIVFLENGEDRYVITVRIAP